MLGQSLIRWTAVLLALTLFCPLVFAQPNRPGQPGRPFPQPGQPGRPFPQPGQPGRPIQPGQPISPGQTGPSDAQVARACGGMIILFVILGVISIVSTIIWIFVLIWVAKDAKARGMDNSALWVVLVLFLGLLGLIIYIVSRPAGDLKICRECGKKRLRGGKRCPHCRAA
jgi:hypothetical protein